MKTKDDTKKHQAHPILSGVLRHIQPIGAEPYAPATRLATSEGELMGRKYTMSVLAGFAGLLVELEPAEGDTAPGGWDRYVVRFGDVLDAVAADVLREKALHGQLSRAAPAGSTLWRCGRHVPRMLRDDAGLPIVGVSDAPAPTPVKLYLIEAEPAWQYILVALDGSMTSVAWGRPPAVPRWKWVP